MMIFFPLYFFNHKSWLMKESNASYGSLIEIYLISTKHEFLSYCLPELALGRPRITRRLCVCVWVYSGYIIIHLLSTLCSRSLLLSTLCACWALADRPTASLFNFIVSLFTALLSVNTLYSGHDMLSS